MSKKKIWSLIIQTNATEIGARLTTRVGLVEGVGVVCARSNPDQTLLLPCTQKKNGARLGISNL